MPWCSSHTLSLQPKLLLLVTDQDSIVAVLAMEIVGPEWRSFVGIMIEMFWVLGYVLCALFAYLARDWSHLEAIFAGICVPFFFYYWSVLIHRGVDRLCSGAYQLQYYTFCQVAARNPTLVVLEIQNR